MLHLLLASVTLLGGISGSRNYGEADSGALFQAGYGYELGQIKLFADTIDKVESSAGYALGLDVDVHRSVGPLAGIGWHYRDGGNWIKHSAWLRLGYAVKQLIASLAFDMNTENRVRMLKLAWAGNVQHFAFEHSVAAARYDGGEWGVLVSASLGWTFNGGRG